MSLEEQSKKSKSSKLIAVLVVWMLLAVHLVTCVIGYFLGTGASVDWVVAVRNLATILIVDVALLYIAAGLLIVHLGSAVLYRKRPSIAQVAALVFLVLMVLFASPRRFFQVGFCSWAYVTVRDTSIEVSMRTLLQRMPENQTEQMFRHEDGGYKAHGGASITDLGGDIMRLKPDYIIYEKSEGARYLALEWGGPLAGRYRLLYEDKGVARFDGYSRKALGGRLFAVYK